MRSKINKTKFIKPLDKTNSKQYNTIKNLQKRGKEKSNEIHTETQNGNDRNKHKSDKTRRIDKPKPTELVAENGKPQLQDSGIRKTCKCIGL